MNLIRAFFSDTVSWMLLVILVVTTIIGFSSLITRYDRVERDRSQMLQLEFDIRMLEEEKQDKTDWLARMKDDPSAWEQVAREKMNYLRRDEVLVTFVPASGVSSP